MLRVALVGAGWIARDHVDALDRSPDAEVVAICDLDPDRARELAPAAASTHTELEELLDATRPDALFVCTPPLAHREHVLAALERGVHVYCEKPVARTLEDADAIVAAVERSGLVCAVGYQWRGLELLDPLREALDGQPVSLVSGRSIGPTQSRPWFLDREQGGGNVLERGSHQLDLLRAIGGEVERVQAVPSRVRLARADGDAGDIEDAASLVLHFEDGGVGAVQVAWTRPGTPGVYAVDVVAPDATLFLDLDPRFRLHGRARGREVDVEAKRHPAERTVARFLEAVREGDPTRVFSTPADARRSLAVALAALDSLNAGGPVAVS